MNLSALFRRPKETTVTTQPEPTITPEDVAMRFLTQGGATVELHTQTFHRPSNSRKDEDGRWVHDWHDAQGFNWRCLGCATVGDDYSAYDEHKPNRSREDANSHADRCRSMPRPVA